jgi:hypothetical protein
MSADASSRVEVQGGAGYGDGGRTAMIFFEMEGLVGLVLFAFWVWCILDVIGMDEGLVRNLPKGAWLFVVLILPDVGGLAWVLMGRPERAGWRPGDTTYRKPFSTRFVVRGPEDAPGFSSPVRPAAPTTPRPAPRQRDAASAAPGDVPSGGANAEKEQELADREEELRARELAIWEADLKRREEELRRKEGGSGLYGGSRW